MARPFRFGPIALTNTLTTNLLNPGTTTGGVNSTAAPYDKLRIVLYHIRVVNKTAGAVTFSLWIGATGANAAGSELASARSVPANDEVSLYFGGRGAVLDTADFLVGGASASTSLSIEGYGEQGVA
jgi:hypothetical protein